MNNVEIELVPGSLERALRAARNTVWKNATYKEPSDKFKRELCRSEHSPLRLVEYYIHIKEIPYWMTAHFTRHKLGVEWFQSTLRDDRTNNYSCGRDELPQGIKVMLDCQINAAELIFMARRRLCHMAHVETRGVMNSIKEAVKKIDPIVAEFMVPNCIYRRFCPESNGCGFSNTPIFNNLCNFYRK